ncbi:MAG: hypothetical protein IPI77_16340 [Saprospiraceae bacterium]|nr:hypothetical protein [Saprospiraceae bacterium]
MRSCTFFFLLLQGYNGKDSIMAERFRGVQSSGSAIRLLKIISLSLSILPVKMAWRCFIEGGHGGYARRGSPEGAWQC